MSSSPARGPTDTRDAAQAIEAHDKQAIQRE
jgi:hypothetical protein